MSRPRLPVAGRRKLGREPRTLCVATALAPDEVERLDRIAGAAGMLRSEYIRAAVLDRMSGERMA